MNSVVSTSNDLRFTAKCATGILPVYLAAYKGPIPDSDAACRLIFIAAATRNACQKGSMQYFIEYEIVAWFLTSASC